MEHEEEKWSKEFDKKFPVLWYDRSVITQELKSFIRSELKKKEEEVKREIENIRHKGDCQKVECGLSFNDAIDDILSLPSLNSKEE